MACPGCKLFRFPEEEIVKKGKKAWVIRTCRICGYKDIEELKANRRHDEDD
jgi:hypothetical protein